MKNSIFYNFRHLKLQTSTHIYDCLKKPAFQIALILISAFIPSFAFSETRIEIDPRIQIAHAYDDNIALEHENAKADQITVLSPQLLISWHAPYTDLEIDYHPGWVNYHTYTERNYLLHNGGLTFWHRFTKHIDFDFQNDLKTTDNFLDVPVVSNWYLPENRGVYYTDNTTAQLNYQFDQDKSINAGYNYRFLINQDTSLLPENRTDAPNDTVRHGPFANLNYQFDIRNGLVLEYRYIRNLYKRADTNIITQVSDTASDETVDDSVSDNPDDTASDIENSDDDTSENENDTVSDTNNPDDDASDQGNSTVLPDNEPDNDEDAMPEPTNDVASDRDFDDQTLIIKYIHRFDRHIKSNLKQRISIHRMLVTTRSSEDYQVYDSTVGLDYQFSRHTGFYLEAGFSKQQGNLSNTSEGILFKGSINHQLRHGGMSLTARNGWNTDSLQESALEEDTGEFTRYWSIRGNINYQPWQNVETYAGMFYRNNTSSSSSTRETWQANCGADIGITNWLALSLNYNHQFRMDEQTEQTLDGDCSLNINALPWLVIGLNYRYRNNISDIPENQYVDNRFTIDFSAARTQPYFWNF